MKRRPCCLAMGYFRGFTLLLIATSFTAANAEVPTPGTVSALRSRLGAMRRALESNTGQLSTYEKQILSAKLGDAEKAFEKYVTLAERGNARDAATLPLYAAGAVLIGDDVSGVGVADDVLLPFVGAALLVAYVTTLPPPTEKDRAAAWAGFIASMQALAQAVTDVAAQRKPGCYCKCYKQGIGPHEYKRVPSAKDCASYCRSIQYPGFQCGGGVIWTN